MSSLDSLLWAAMGGQNNNDSSNNNNEPPLQFLFVGGKGGVGKTTSSSAIATLLATHCQKRVLLVSTDPAHSLSDAFRQRFTNQPTPVLSSSQSYDFNLHVVEIDPSETMQTELAKWSQLANDLTGNSSSNHQQDDEMGTMAQKIHSFQEWLSGVPGIDEATALASAIQWIESGHYDIIVFDTAPTGHTLKLLQMPEILQQGIERLQGWQSTLWGYWEMFKGVVAATSQTSRNRAKAQVAEMLQNYKENIQKVALMLQDQKRTRFAVVCIAEYLSISETQRLLEELNKNRVRASHIIVNQLVIQDALSQEELSELEALAEVGHLHLNNTLLAKTVHANRLTTARKAIQEKYLAQLKSFSQTKDLDGVCELPLLPEEVTGIEALQRFGKLMVQNPPQLHENEINNNEAKKASVAKPLYDDQLSTSSAKHDIHSQEWKPKKGDLVKLKDLAKSAQYNGLEGRIISDLDPETGRYGVEVVYNDKTKHLSLHKKNMDLVDSCKKFKQMDTRSEQGSGAGTSVVVTEENVLKAQKVLDDPEIKAMVDGNPRFANAVQDVMTNPMNFMKYLMDPEMSPLIQKAMSKLQQQ